jgi:hypothetical protein
MRPKGLGKLKQFIHLFRNWTRDLPACSIVPQLLDCRVPHDDSRHCFFAVLVGRLYNIVQLYSSIGASQRSTSLAKFSGNGCLCVELAVRSNFSRVRTAGVLTVRCGVLLISRGMELGVGVVLSAETDSNRSIGLPRLHQGFTTWDETQTAFRCLSGEA